MASRGPTSAPFQPATPFGRLFGAFSSRDFRLLWAFNAFNSLGMSMEALAQGWLVLDITDSPFWVGAAAGLRGIGQVSFGAVGGVIADRMNRRAVLAVVQPLRALALLTLGLLIFYDRIEVWHLLVVALFQGMSQAVLLPSNDALIFDAVGVKRLLNAVAAKHIAFDITRVGGSIVAGTLISTLGVQACYFTVAAAIFISPIPLLFLRVGRTTSSVRKSVWRNLVEGVRYAGETNNLRALLLFSVTMEMFGFSYNIMLPVVAKNVLNVGATGLGYLSAAGSMGALVGSLTVASLGDFRAKGLLLVLTAAGAGLSILVFALSSWYALSLAMAVVVGGTLVAYDATMSTLLQTLASDAMRGRILGLYGLTFGFTPVGGFMAGVVATVVGAQATASTGAQFAVGTGAVVILSSVVVIMRPIRRVREATERPPRTSEASGEGS